MAGHQNLGRYDGSLYGEIDNRGMEYSTQVPDNMVIGSPGGVSSTHHHYTRGFYGQGGSSSDHYAGQGERYNHGVYGGVYETGHTASEKQGYYPEAPDKKHWENNTQHESFELIEPVDIDEPGNYQNDNQIGKWTVLFMLAFLAFMVFSFSSKSVESLITEKIFKGKKMNWHQMGVFATIFSLIFSLFLWTIGSSVIKI